MNPNKATCLSVMLNLYKVVLYLAMTHSATQTRARNIQTNAPHFARHEECADKIADFANCLALLDTGHIVWQPNADFLAKPESASIQCFLLYYCPMGSGF